jgi:hypothetical protein
MPLTVRSGEMLTFQPSEDYDITFSYAGTNVLPVGVTVSSAEFFAYRVGILSTTLAADATAGATTVSLTADVGLGAKLVLEDGTARREVVKVSTLSGDGPYSAGIVPGLRYAHAALTAVSYQLGVSAIILGTTTASGSNNTVGVLIQKIIDGEQYHVHCRVLLSNTRHLEDEVVIIGRERP